MLSTHGILRKNAEQQLTVDDRALHKNPTEASYLERS